MKFFDDAFLKKHPGWHVTNLGLAVKRTYHVEDEYGELHRLEVHVHDDGRANFFEPAPPYEGPWFSFKDDPERAVARIESFLEGLDKRDWFVPKWEESRTEPGHFLSAAPGSVVLEVRQGAPMAVTWRVVRACSAGSMIGFGHTLVFGDTNTIDGAQRYAAQAYNQLVHDGCIQTDVKS